MIGLMSRGGLPIRAVFALLFLFVLCFSTTIRAQESCVTAQCHEPLLKAKTVHPATEACDTCHESTASPHPQKGKKTFKLAQELPELCANCHDAFGQKKDVHPPVKEGDCTTCHDPHASDEPKLLVQPAKDLCTTCHSDKMDFKLLHGPAAAGDCTACHNPHESDIKPLLVKKAEDLCFGCHIEVQDALKKKNVHAALEMGCTSCHNPHGSQFPKLLAAQGKELCFQCHDDISGIIADAKVVHPPVNSEKGCVSCHSPHASDHAKLLLMEGKDLCLDCHKNIIAKNMTVLHGPIKDGTCTPCHNPHGSPNTSLLIKEFPPDQYVAYTDKEYELCFSCHNRDLVAYPDTSFATNFRDGDRNLHYLHVNKQEKGRSCRMCHNLHGSENPKLIATGVVFGKWSLPLNFVKTETGGSCTPGCHKQQNYDRKNPGKAPEKPKPPQKSN
jgi:predicted CXXCH cytochrome family protein